MLYAYLLLLTCIISNEDLVLGGKLGALPIGTKGRKLRKDMSIVCAHAG